jgi:hypothetical protein
MERQISVIKINILSMLEYFKTILQKVSFDGGLFEKELKKAVSMLIPQELKELKEWCYTMFGDIYSVILNKYLSDIPL